MENGSLLIITWDCGDGGNAVTGDSRHHSVVDVLALFLCSDRPEITGNRFLFRSEEHHAGQPADSDGDISTDICDLLRGNDYHIGHRCHFCIAVLHASDVRRLC